MRGGRALCLAVLLAACMPAACTRREPPPSLERTATDEERFLLPRLLEPGADPEDVRAVVPALSAPVATGSPGGDRATAPVVLFGRTVDFEAFFREGALSSCGYLFVTADPADAGEFAALLRRTGTAALGNFHEERRPGTDADTVRWFWAEGATSLTVEWITGGRHVVRARFLALPGQAPPAV